jgi:2-succinyl-5-enolpyruvyl-6-hydroxy-3-cyclohexene-1-carboxylate synthase
MVDAPLQEIPEQRNLATWWAAHAIDELHRLGVRHLVISPGSRSTPLTMAASVHPEMQTQVVLDERSAGFTALGMGRATGTPAALICTSGTAVANYFPAVIEARQSGIPLLLLTADRPPNLRQIGASQAIDQIKIFGDYPVFFHEVGEPQTTNQDHNRLRGAVDQAVFQSKQQGGPAHLNFPFRKPLEPDAEWLRTLQLYWDNQSETLEPFRRIASSTPTHQHWPSEIRTLLSEAQRPLFVAGPQRPYDHQTTAFVEWAQAMNAPLLVESGAQPMQHDLQITGFDGWLRGSYRDEQWKPDLVIRLGDQPVSKALELAFTQWKSPLIQVSTRENWQDATLNGGIYWPVKQLPDWSSDMTFQTDSDWFQSWKQHDQAWLEYRSQIMTNAESLTDGHIYHQLLPALKTYHNPLNGFVSNSFPVRDIMLFGPETLPVQQMHVTRGASGIDGIISSAIGATRATQQAGVLFIGDLAFLHDSNALLQHSDELPPLLIVVINNGGGDIFKMLPIEDHPDQFERYFKTPQQTDLGRLCQAHHVPHRRIQTVEQLRNEASGDFMPDKGLQVLECVTDSDSSMQLRRKLWEFSDG